jgi:hypothetical protein
LASILSLILVAGCYNLNPSEYSAPDGAASFDAPTTQGADGASSDVPMGTGGGGTGGGGIGGAGGTSGGGSSGGVGGSGGGGSSGGVGGSGGGEAGVPDASGIQPDVPMGDTGGGGTSGGGGSSGGGTDAGLGALIISFSCGTATVSAGHSTTLTATFNEGKGEVTPSIGPVYSGAPVSTGPLNATTTYTLTVTADSGASSTAQVTVNVVLTPITLVSGLFGVSGIAIDSANLYFLGGFRDSAGVMKVALAGGDSVPLSTDVQTSAIAADGTNVYWTHYDSGPATGSVMKVAVTGGAPIPLASGPHLVEPDLTNAIATDGAYVYWFEPNSAPQGGMTPQVGTGSVMKVAVTGGDPITLADGQDKASAFAIDATNVYWNGYSMDNGGSLTKIAQTGGKPFTLAIGLPMVGPIAVDANGVYWGGGMKVALGGGAPVDLLSSGGATRGASDGIAVDDTNVYWLSGSSVMKVSLKGGNPVCHALFQSTGGMGRGLVADGTSVYWVAVGGPNGDWAILKAAK